MAQRVTRDYAPIALPVRLNNVPETEIVAAFDLRSATVSEATGMNRPLQFTLDFLNSKIAYTAGPEGKVEALTGGSSRCRSANGVAAA